MQAAQAKPLTALLSFSFIQNNACEGALFLTEKKGLFNAEPQAPANLFSNAENAQTQAAVIIVGKIWKLSQDPWAHQGKPFQINATGIATRD